MTEIARCQICGEPMPPGEEMFNFHGYSGNCPKPPLRPTAAERDALRAEHQRLKDAVVQAAKEELEAFNSLKVTPGYSVGASVRCSAMRLHLHDETAALAAFEAQHPEVRG